MEAGVFPLEMLAAGCIPVVSDTSYARTDLNNPFIAYAQPYPQALSAQLEAVLATQDFDFLSSAAAASVDAVTWDEAGAQVDRIIRQAMDIHANPPASKDSDALG